MNEFYIGADKEIAAWEALNELSEGNLNKEIEFNENTIDDYHKFNYKSLLEVQEKNILMQKRNINSKALNEIITEFDVNEGNNNEMNEILDMMTEIEEKFIDKKSIKDQIEKNYYKLEKIKESYYKYSNMLTSEMSSRQKEECNYLYEQQLKIAEENKELLEKCKKSKL